MASTHSVWARLFRRRELDEELDEELRAHLRQAVEDRIARGESPSDAAANARREFGNEGLTREVTRQMWGWTRLERVLHDLKYALRQMLRTPGFTVVVIVSLALGIGANTAIFSILNSLLLRALPVEAPQELSILRKQSNTNVAQRFSYPMFQRFRDAGSGAQALAAMSRITHAQAAIGQGSLPEAAEVQLVSGEFFPLLGVSAALGRTLAPSDNLTLDGHPVAVISYDYWQRRFAGAAGVIRSAVRLNGTTFTIVGVGPPDFRGVWVESPTDIWVPLMMQTAIHYAQNYSGNTGANPEQPWPPQEGITWLDVIVRTAPEHAGSAREALNTAYFRSLTQLTASLPESARRTILDQRLSFFPFVRGLSNLRLNFSSSLFAMMALVALVLLIACANTANLLLARAESRRREIAVRLSIGASRGRVVQQLLTESLLLAGAAAGLGLVVAHWSADVLVRMALGVANGQAPLSVPLDGRVLAFTIGISLATGLLFGLAPALRASKTELAAAMKAGSRSVAGHSPLSPAKFLVAAQIALSLLVVAGAGLFARSLNNLASLRLGFDREHVLSVWINPRAAGLKPEQLPALYRGLAERVEAVPGVRSAAISMCALVVECRSTTDTLHFPGYEPRPGESVQVSAVGPKYFSTIGASVTEGREFDAHDGTQGRRVIVVNEALVRKYFRDRSPVGQQVRATLNKSNVVREPTEVAFEIIGVIGDARVNRVREAAVPMAYYPFAGEGAREYANSLEVRAAGDPQAVSSAVRVAVAEVAPGLPVERITLLTKQVDRSLNQERLISVLATVFGALALGLACFGLYGVVSHGVARRVSEIGVRIALGARPADVLWAILKGALALIALGLVVGLPAVWLASGSVAPLLFDVKPNDPTTLLTAVFVLTVTAILAALLPAWRASRVNPMVALRNE